MTVPDFQSLMLPLLKMTRDGPQHNLAEAVERLSQDFQLTDEDRTQLLKSGQTRLYNRVGWTTSYLRKAGLLRADGPGRFQLTDRGREVLASKPATIDVAYLESRFQEMSEFRKGRPKSEVAGDEPSATFNRSDCTWSQRPNVGERVREKLTRSIPIEQLRNLALEFLAFAIEVSDEERDNAWYLRETEHGLRLMTGRLIARALKRSQMRVSVIGPVGDDIRDALGADSEHDEDFKNIPGGVLLTFPVEHAARAMTLLKDGFSSFVEMAMARVRTGRPRRPRPGGGRLHRECRGS